jgi:hypothetical protein
MTRRRYTRFVAVTLAFAASNPPPSTGIMLGWLRCVFFLAVPAKFLLPECQFSYMLYENEDIYFLSVFRPA